MSLLHLSYHPFAPLVIYTSMPRPEMLMRCSNWGGRTGLFWAGLGLLCITWTYFRQPEMKGRTYGELDTLFEQKISARKFSKTVVDQFQNDGSAEANGTGSPRDTVVDVNEKAGVEKGRSERWVEGEMPKGTV